MSKSMNASQLLKNGIFAVNKTNTITSAETLNKIKEILYKGTDEKFIRMGHGGTLDKSADGVLIIGINWGCKKLPILLNGPKTYIALAQLGIGTDTYNESGEITEEKPFDHVKESDIKELLPKFTGEILQKAPIYSALKINRRRMSDLAREGIQLEQKERQVTCYSIECTDFNSPYFTIKVRCGGGFYVRSLIHDIGQALGTCAHIRQLQRTEQGPFSLEDCLDEGEWTTEKILEIIPSCSEKFTKYEQERKGEKSNK